MGVGSEGQGSRGSTWIFIYGTDIVDRGLIRVVLFFGLFCYSAIFRSFFFVAPPPLEIFLLTPLPSRLWS